MKKSTWIFVVLLILACAPTSKNKTVEITPPSSDGYGFCESNPVKVGGFLQGEGPEREHQYLQSLTGPNGESLNYHRLGSCCPYKRNTSGDYGFLDRYEVTYDGLNNPLIIYIDMYRNDGRPGAPKGLIYRVQ